MTRKLLVLGGSLYQLDAIEAAQRLGYRVIVTDNVPSNPGHRVADRSHPIDTTDRAAVLAMALEEKIDGVIAPCTDVAVPTAAHVANCLHIPGPPEASVDILCDKVRFRRFMAEHELPHPRWCEFTTKMQPDPSLFSSGCCVMKPDQSSGSKGIFIVRSKAEFQLRFEECLEFSPNGRGILEEFIDGHQGTYEGIIHAGRVVLSWVMDRITAPPPYVVTRGQRLPSRLSTVTHRAVHAAVERILSILGVTDGPFDCDFVASAKGVRILEMSPRLGGNSISTLVRKACGFDLVEYAVRQACGDAPPVPAPLPVRPTAVVLLGTEQAGRLVYDIAQVESLRREAWVDSLVLDERLDAPVKPFINGRRRVGVAFVWGEDRDDLDGRVEELTNRLNLRAV